MATVVYNTSPYNFYELEDFSDGLLYNYVMHNHKEDKMYDREDGVELETGQWSLLLIAYSKEDY